VRAAARGEPYPFASTDDTVVIPIGSTWRVPWELLMLGPFASCVLADGYQARHVTAGALMRSAAKRSSGPDELLYAEDYEPLPIFGPTTTLFEAAILSIEAGWEFAVVNEPQPRLVTPRSVFWALLRSPGSATLAEAAFASHRSSRSMASRATETAAECLRAAQVGPRSWRPNDFPDPLE
jgi:hypothetical protein